MGADFGFEAFARLEADDVVDRLAILEQNESGQSHDAVLLHDVGVDIDIEGANDQFIGVFVGKVIDKRRDHFTRGTPFRRKIDQDGQLRFEDDGLEILGG
jgi:hypothetical protein